MRSQEMIINRIIDLKEQKGHSDEEIIDSIEKEYLITSDEAESIFDLVNTGIFRALLIAESKEYPKNNLNNHPVIIETISIFLRRIGKENLIPTKKKRGFKLFKYSCIFHV